MIDTVNVVPSAAGRKLKHPVSGVLPDSGGPWLADQFTFRLIGEGAITRMRHGDVVAQAAPIVPPAILAQVSTPIPAPTPAAPGSKAAPAA